MTNRSTENAIIRLLMERAPNWVNDRVLKRTLPDISDGILTGAIDQLINSGKIVRAEDSRGGHVDTVVYYRPASYEGMPVKDVIKFEDVEINRLLASGNPVFFPEEFNEAVENLAKHANGLQERFQRLVRKEQQKYWGNIISIFGVFISILAFILVGLPKITTEPTLSFCKVVVLNLGQLLPLAVVLAIFIVVLRVVIR